MIGALQIFPFYPIRFGIITVGWFLHHFYPIWAVSARRLVRAQNGPQLALGLRYLFFPPPSVTLLPIPPSSSSVRPMESGGEVMISGRDDVATHCAYISPRNPDRGRAGNWVECIYSLVLDGSGKLFCCLLSIDDTNVYFLSTAQMTF